jgi:exopolyphosphatase / guanosine-5'-triphosphate,3'-diphosphate pyrophosphatase
MDASLRVAVIDVGSNTVRLLVAAGGAGPPVPVRAERAQVGLARDVERRGRISKMKIREAVRVTRGFARMARDLGVVHLEVLVTAPGRQSENGGALLEALEAGTGSRARALSAEEEARLAFAGAIATLPRLPASIAVCDVGGGSTQLVFGTGSGEPVWFRSLDIGSLRLAQRFLENDPPTAAELEALRVEVERRFSGLAPPLPRAALATGGTARALRRVVGRTLGPKQLEKACERLTRRRAQEIARAYGVETWRAETLSAGAIVLAEAQRRLGVPLVVARAGLREGAVLGLLAQAEAAA